MRDCACLSSFHGPWSRKGGALAHSPWRWELARSRDEGPKPTLARLRPSGQGTLGT